MMFKFNKKLIRRWDIAKRDFLNILASHVYAPGTIAINVTWMERGFNAGQTHNSIDPSSTVYELARYWSETAAFSYLFPGCFYQWQLRQLQSVRRSLTSWQQLLTLDVLWQQAVRTAYQCKSPAACRWCLIPPPVWWLLVPASLTTSLARSFVMTTGCLCLNEYSSR